MRDYAIVSPKFWSGETGRRIREKGHEAQVVGLYLLTSPSSSMLGLYYLPVPTLMHEVGLSFEEATQALRDLADVGFAYYDNGREEVWVPEMARFQIAEELKPSDNRWKCVVRELEEHAKSRFHAAFLRRYAHPFKLPTQATLQFPQSTPTSIPNVSGIDTPTPAFRTEEQPASVTSETEAPAQATQPLLPLDMTPPPADFEQASSEPLRSPLPGVATPLRSQDQDQEQEQDQDHEQIPPLSPQGGKAPPRAYARKEQPAWSTSAMEAPAQAAQPPLPLDLTSPPALSGQPLPGKATAHQRRVVDRHRPVAETVLEALNAARKRVRPVARGIQPSYESLLHISERLDAGKTAADCIHVIAVCEAECHAHQSRPNREDPFRFFNPVSPFRPMNFERHLADDPRDSSSTGGAGAKQKHKPADCGPKPMTREIEIT